MTVVDSPPGMTSASTFARSSAFLTGSASAPARSNAAMCSTTSP